MTGRIFLRLDRILIFLLLTSGFFLSLQAEEDHDSILSRIRSDLVLTGLQMTWEPVMHDELELNRFIKTRTTGEESVAINFHLAWDVYSLVDVHYKLPLKPTPEMKRIIEYNRTTESSLEDFEFMFMSDALFPEVFGARLLDFFTRFRYRYSRRMYITSATNDEAFYVIPENAVYHESNNTIDPMEYVPAGSELTWTSTMILQELTFRFWELEPTASQKARYSGLLPPSNLQLRVGVYVHDQTQPAKGLFTYEGKETVMVAKLRSIGPTLQIVSSDIGDEGLHLNARLRMGWFENSIESAAWDWYRTKIEPDAYPSYVAIGGKLWYNLEIMDFCYLSAGIDLEVNAFLIEVQRELTEEEEEEGVDPVEIRWRIRQVPIDYFLTVGFSF